MQAILGFLWSWQELWRYPDLASALWNDEIADEVTAARLMIRGMAHPCGPREALGHLIDAGEFVTAAAILEDDAFRAALATEDLNSLHESLRVARLRAHDETSARAAELRHRAEQCNHSVGAPSELEILEALDERRCRADERLDLWEESIAVAEQETTLSLRERLDRATGDRLDSDTRRQSIHGCIEAREFERARFLLESEGSGPLPAAPFSVPRQPGWPWDQPLTEVFSWLDEGADSPPGFVARWRHSDDDAASALLVQALRPILLEGSIRPETVSAFASALDQFLGCPQQAEYTVTRRANGLETRLHSVRDIRIPAFAAYGDCGVPLWIPLKGKYVLPDSEADTPVRLVFASQRPRLAGPSFTFFGADSLLRLLSTPEHRKVNFLREVGGKLALEDAIPADAHTLVNSIVDPARARAYASWLFDMLDVEVTNASLPDVLAYYAGGRMDLLLCLMRTLLAGLRDRSSRANLASLSKAWVNDAFREAATSVLLAPLEFEPAARAVLGAAIVAAEAPGSEVALRDIISAIELCERGLPDEDVQASLNMLADMGLLVVDQPGERYRLPSSGVGFLLVYGVRDAYAYVRRALDCMG